MKRQRGRGRKPGGGGGGGGGGNHNHGNRSLESNGPEVKIRGTATQIYEKYTQYARDAQSGGDRVKYESFLQHAEHYYRVMAASMPRDRLLAQQEAGQLLSAQQDAENDAQNQPEGNLGGEQPDSMKVMDDQGGDDGDDGYDGDDGDEPRNEGGGEEAQAGGGNTSGAPQDDRDDGQGQGQGQGRGRRRRGRRRPHDGPQGDRPNNNGGGGNGGGGGDTEARSALDLLARKQGALAGD